MDRFEAMTMLLAAVETGSLSAAARSMRVPVPTLSRKVADLEQLLGTKLLIRTTRKLTLTDAGTAYVASARLILEQLEEAEREAAGEFQTPRGELALTAPLFFGRLHVLPVVADFLALFPEINVRLLLGDRNFNLIDDHVDMAVRMGNLPDSDLIATRIGTMRSVICASPQFLDGHGTPLTVDDLRQLPCLMNENQSISGVWRLRNPATGGLLELPLVPRLATSAEGAADAAVRGIGVACLRYYQAYDAIAAGKLVSIMQPHEPDPAPIHLLHAARGQLPLKMRRFLDFAAPRLRRSLAKFGVGDDATATDPSV